MHALKGRKQSAEHIEKRAAALRGRKRAEGAGGGRPPNTVDSIKANVARGKRSECWPWMGQLKDGYGRFERLGKNYYAHRVVMAIKRSGEAWESDDLDGLDVMHHCDNPICCNPRHLKLATHAENMKDKVRKGRQARFTSVGSPRAKLSAEDVFFMRMQKKYGATKKALAMLYEVSEATVSGVLYGRHYKDVA